MTKVLTWLYNEQGHLEVWEGELTREELDNKESGLYLQGEDDVKGFLDNEGFTIEEVRIGDWNTSTDLGYF